MSSKAENTSNHSYKQPRLNIFFRSPLLLKIVAWLGSLSFLGSTGLVLADLKPTSTPKIEAQEIIQASALPANGTAVKLEDRETYGPYLPLAQKPSPVQADSAQVADRETYGPYLLVTQKPSPVQADSVQLPNREVPIAVSPSDAVILPTGTIVRPRHTDLLTADNYTVGVNESASAVQATEEIVNISVPAPRSRTIPSQSREIISAKRSKVQPSYVQPQSVISQSVPTTSIQSKSKPEQSVNGYRSVPAVANIPNPTLPRLGRAGSTLPTSVTTTPIASQSSQRQPLTPQVVPLAGLSSTALAPLKPSISAQTKPASISASTPRNQRVEVQAVARLPQLSGTKAVPTVPAIPIVRPAAMSQSQPINFANTGIGETSSQLIYPLSSVAPTTSSFGWRTHPITGNRRFHSGIDIGAPMGAPVVAAGSGIIMTAGWLGGYGKTIVIQHNGVQQTLYGHLSEVFVQPGQRIEQGTVIGRVGSTGNSTGPHLHFETKVATADGWVAVDPGDDIKYALDNLRRSAPFAQRDLPPGYN